MFVEFAGMADELTHFDASGASRMVNVGGKPLTKRMARASGRVVMQPATLAWGSGIANFAMNRREFTDKGVILGVNPRGPVDRTVPVLRVGNLD